VHIPFVLFRTQCLCGAPVLIKNPRLSDDYIRTARRCLDCGDPILPRKPKGRVPKVREIPLPPHPWICASCQEHHRADEPGTDLDSEIKDWLHGKPIARRTYAPRGAWYH